MSHGYINNNIYNFEFSTKICSLLVVLYVGVKHIFENSVLQTKIPKSYIFVYIVTFFIMFYIIFPV